MKIDILLSPGAAPLCKFSGGVICEQSTIDTSKGPQGADIDGMHVRISEFGQDDLQIRAQVAMPSARDILVALYRDYFNNYLTPETYGKDHGLTKAEAEALLTLARTVEGHPHPES